MSRYFLLLWFCLLALAGFAQNPVTFRVQHFTTENGLPSNGIKGLKWDEKTGYLWIATEAGVVRYNGMEFKIYDANDEPHITNERCIFMVRNNAGRIYTADNYGNIFYIEKNKLVFFDRRANVPGVNYIGIAFSDKLYNTKIQYGEPAWSAQFNQTFPVDDTAGYVINSGHLIYFSHSVTSPVVVNKNVSYGFKCGNHLFMQDQEKNIYRVDRSSKEILQKTSLEGVTAEQIKHGYFSWETGMKHPVLFSGKNAWLIIYDGGKLTSRLICDIVPQDVLIRYVQYDEERKTLFIGTDSEGLIVIEQNRVLSVKAPLGTPNQRNSYYSQIELSNGNVLTNEGHILGFSLPRQPLFPITGRFSMNTLMVGDSVLWFTQPIPGNPNISLLYQYNFRTGVKKMFPNIRENYLLVMAASGDDLYMSRDSGIYRLRNDSLEQLFVYNGRKSGMDYDMKEISPGIFLIANCNSLLRFDVNERKLDTVYGPDKYCFRTIWKYKDYVFIGSYGAGLFIYKNGIINPLPLDKNKYLLFTHCFVKDDEDYCWISTNRGLFKTSIADLTDAFDKNATEVYYYFYGKNDGMDMTEMNGGCTPCALIKKDKTISFPTMDGLLWVHPAAAKPVLPNGDIDVDNISVDSLKIDPDSFHTKELTWKTKEIIIRLGISAFGNKENIYLDYRLNGEPWRPVDIERGMEIRFSNLPSGDYNLEIRKRNGFGADNYSYKLLQFHITTPWYKKWWFYPLLILAIAGLFRIYLNFRTRQLIRKQFRLETQVAEKTRELQLKNEVLEKADTIKTRLISIISHDIITPLKFLTAGGKNLVEKKELMSEDLQKETLREMVNTSQELQLLSTNILNWIKYQNENRRLAKEQINAHELTNQVLGVLNSLAKQKNISLKNEIDPDLNIYQYYEPLSILIYNLVSNAISFTDRGSIIIGNKGDTVLFVKDEGVGMTPEQIQNILSDQFIVSSANIDNRKGNGLGYLIIKDLLKIMGSAFSIQSEKGRGTTVSIILKNDGNVV